MARDCEDIHDLDDLSDDEPDCCLAIAPCPSAQKSRKLRTIWTPSCTAPRTFARRSKKAPRGFRRRAQPRKDLWTNVGRPAKTIECQGQGV